MDPFGLSDRLCEMDESDFPNLDNDIIFDTHQLEDQLCDSQNFFDSTPDWLSSMHDPVLNDKMISEAVSSLKQEVVDQGDAGCAEVGNFFRTVNALDDDIELSINPAICTGTVPHASLHVDQKTQPAPILKPEPKIIVKTEPVVFETRRTPQQKSLLKPTAIVLTTQVSNRQVEKQIILQNFSNVPETSSPMEESEDTEIIVDGMPMTPPSSGTGSDSEGGASPHHSPPLSPLRIINGSRIAAPVRITNPATAIYSQPIPTSGLLVLTEEEKRTFMAEGYPLPNKLPLTKTEEKNLKKVRRKIKNKISAQESRRKKKEYMDHLEKRVEDISKENGDLRRRCDQYENSNRSLMSQLARLQNLLKQYTPKLAPGAGQTGTCLLVLILCFSVFLGNWSPIGMGSSLGFGSSVSENAHTYSLLDAYSTPDLKSSRTLMTMTEESHVCGKEPWPVFIARISFEGLTNLISSQPAVVSDNRSDNMSLVGEPALGVYMADAYSAA